MEEGTHRGEIQKWTTKIETNKSKLITEKIKSEKQISDWRIVYNNSIQWSKTKSNQLRKYKLSQKKDLETC